jgi:hypothetical protein
MQDDIYAAADSAPAKPVKPPRRARGILTVALLAFLIGAALVGWLVWDGRVDGLLPDRAAQVVTPERLAEIAQPAPAATPQVETAINGVESRVEMLEDRLSRLKQQAEAASGEAARAEGLLIAFAARRMIDRGAPLGYLENQLKLRFADAQPNAVQVVIDAAKQPITLDELSSQLEAAGPSLARAPDKVSGWASVQRELTSLFTIRHDRAIAADPQVPFNRAKMLLVAGKVDAAIAEIQRLPGAAGAQSWIGAARRYTAAQRALDLIETAALFEPVRLRDGMGQTVDQPSPIAAPPQVVAPAA